MIFLKLFWAFFKIGAVTVGGGYAMLPFIQEEVLRQGWLSADEIVNFIAVSESTPGPFAINISTYVGSVMGGQAGLGVFGTLFGAFCATMGVVLPSFVIILIVAKIYDAFKKSKAVKGIMTGLKPAVVGLIAAAVLTIVSTVFAPNGWALSILKDIHTYVYLALFAVASVLAFKKVHPILIILISAAAGIAVGFLV
ncbi:MAG: chromate transporter [Clostridia bacterium]|nr:chromate transporter [Clostridia bacterium]